MEKRFDIVLQNGSVVDPVNGRSGRFDVGIAGGKIARIADRIDPALSDECFDVSGFHVVPGIIDLHVHVDSDVRGRYGHKMMAQAGVTTALNMAGTMDLVLDAARDFGAGLNIASLSQVQPGNTVSDVDPITDEVEALLRECLNKGAIGLKILGGHFPMKPEATARIIEVAARNRAYIAMHAGTLETRSSLSGFAEAVSLAAGHPLHLAHVNSYTRGLEKPYMEEVEEAISLLIQNPNICSESYLSRINGTSGRCIDGIPESKATQIWLSHGEFEPTEKGMADAIRTGWARVNIPSGGAVVLAGGAEAVKWWKDQGTRVALSFNVNPPEPRIRLATAKRNPHDFVVDSISTDGGGIPRNVIVEMGLALVNLDALTIEEFVIKTSRNPARLLSIIRSKGHLGEGADADISVLDLTTQKPVMALANGKLIMYKGHVCGSGSRIITTPAGEAYVRQKGLDALVVDPESTPFLERD
jgi:predicted amidohydrolase